MTISKRTYMDLVAAQAEAILRLEAENARLREALGAVQDRFGPAVGRIVNVFMSPAEGAAPSHVIPVNARDAEIARMREALETILGFHPNHGGPCL